MKVINIVTLQKVLRRAIGRCQETHGVRLDKETADDLMQVLDSFPANEQVTEENPLIGKQVIVWEYIEPYTQARWDKQ